MRCCCSAGVAPQGFACGELVYLRDCFRCSFLLSFPPASSFSSPPRFLRGSPPPELPPYPPASSFSPPQSPRPRRSPRGTSDYPCAATEASTTATQFSDPISIGCVKIGLRLFSRRVKTLAWCYFLHTRVCNLAHPLQKPDFPKTIPLFCSILYRACEIWTSTFFAVKQNTSLGRLLQTRFPIFAYCL